MSNLTISNIPGPQMALYLIGCEVKQEGRRLSAEAAAAGYGIAGAASVSFELSIERSRAIGVEGTRRMLELASLCARRGDLRRFTYISTAYVAGEHRGVYAEDDLDVGQRFRNPYEQSKFEAEALLRSWSSRLPITVVRPSIIVGDRHSGWTAAFNVLCWPLHALSRGAYPILPARRASPTRSKRGTDAAGRVMPVLPA